MSEWKQGYPPQKADWNKYEVYFAPMCVWHRLKTKTAEQQLEKEQKQ